MRTLLRYLGFAGSIVLAYFLPSLVWSVTWGDLFKIISETNSGAGKTLNWLTEITKQLGINQSSIREWAFQKIFISIGIGVGAFIVILVLTAFIKQSNPQKIEGNKND